MHSTLIEAIVQTCSDTPRPSIEKACTVLAESEADALAALPKLAGTLSKESLSRLRKGLREAAITTGALALALRTTAAGIDAGKASPDMQLVWTGPETPHVSPRDTLPQMLEMIGRAKKSILLVTFAAFKAKPLMDALVDAQSRGVDLMVVVETAKDSAGQLSHAAWKAFPTLFLSAGCIWFWPLAKRTKNAKGLPGKLHAKCLVVDQREFLLSSANVTEDAMMRNIELGIQCVNENLACRIVQCFRHLAQEGALKQLVPET